MPASWRPMTCGIWGIDESNVGRVALQATALPPELIPHMAGMTRTSVSPHSHKHSVAAGIHWWAVRGTIPRPCACKAPALPTELTARSVISFAVALCRRCPAPTPRRSMTMRCLEVERIELSQDRRCERRALPTELYPHACSGTHEWSRTTVGCVSCSYPTVERRGYGAPYVNRTHV